MAKINPDIFKEYDIRGKYPREVNEKVAYQIGQGLVGFLGVKNGDKIVVGRDSRPSSPKLSEALISGIIDAGVNIVDLGEIKTPMLYFAISYLQAKGGAMITASHLSDKDNGVKFARANSLSIGGKELQPTIEALTQNKTETKKGIIEKIDIEKPYLNKIYKKINHKIHPVRNSHGLSQQTIDSIIGEQGIISNGVKINIPHSFDSDGDRLIVYDENKKIVRGDIIGGILADAVAKKGDTIIYGTSCTHNIPKYFRNKGIIAIPCREGTFNITKMMAEKKAVFGMEISGHYSFKDFSYSSTPLYSLRIIAEQMAVTKKTLAELAKPFTKSSHSGEINIEIKNIEDFEKIKRSLKEKYGNGSQDEMDGLTIEFSNWWFNLRPSHTEPILRLVVEARDEKMMKEKVEEILSLIK